MNIRYCSNRDNCYNEKYQCCLGKRKNCIISDDECYYKECNNYDCCDYSYYYGECLPHNSHCDSDMNYSKYYNHYSMYIDEYDCNNICKHDEEKCKHHHDKCKAHDDKCSYHHENCKEHEERCKHDDLCNNHRQHCGGCGDQCLRCKRKCDTCKSRCYNRKRRPFPPGYECNHYEEEYENYNIDCTTITTTCNSYINPCFPVIPTVTTPNHQISGTVEKIDESGKIELPKDIGEKLNLQEGDKVIVSEENGVIVIRKIE